jgi:hypothetical protein
MQPLPQLLASTASAALPDTAAAANNTYPCIELCLASTEPIIVKSNA